MLLDQKHQSNLQGLIGLNSRYTKSDEVSQSNFKGSIGKQLAKKQRKMSRVINKTHEELKKNLNNNNNQMKLKPVKECQRGVRLILKSELNSVVLVVIGLM